MSWLLSTCYSGRWGICVFFSYGFLRVDAQQWDGWRMSLNHRKQPILVSSTEMDEPTACYTEWRKSEREKQILYINAYLWSLEKNGTDEPICRAAIETKR